MGDNVEETNKKSSSNKYVIVLKNTFKITEKSITTSLMISTVFQLQQSVSKAFE